MVNLEHEIKRLGIKFNLTPQEILQRIRKIVRDLSGLIDEEGGLTILRKELEEKPLDKSIISKSKPQETDTPTIHIPTSALCRVFLDIDEDMDIALDHLRTHAHVLTRKSVNEKLHAIVFDSCDKCLDYSDETYEGKVLFNNKGDKWADMEWVNLQTNKPELVESENMVHILLRIIDNKVTMDDTKDNIILRHIYTDIWYFRLNFEDMIPNPEFIEQEVEIYYTFHSIVSNTLERYWECKDQSGDKEQRFEQLIRCYQFKKYDTFRQLMNDYLTFITHLPQEIVD